MTSVNDFETITPGLTTGPVTGLPENDRQTLIRLIDVWNNKRPGNMKRTDYFNAHEKVKNLRIAVPDKIADKVGTVVGWPAKAVKALADLSVYQGLSAPDDAQEAVQIARASRLELVVPEAIVSAYKHSCSFLTVYKTEDGTARIIPRSALMSSAIWDLESQSVSSAMTITRLETDTTGTSRVSRLMLWLPGRAWIVTRDQGAWSAQPVTQTYPGVSVVPVVHDPQLDRPFGRSRITRPLIAYTNMAVRTLIRQEATAEFYSAPHLWFLGAAPDAVNADKWSSLINAINGISKDEDGDKPVMQQVAQASMQPHGDMLKTIAMLVSSETNIPVSDLGVTTENPASAESMAEAERKLTREADRQNIIFSDAIGQALRIAYCCGHDTDTAPDSWQQIRPVWAETREISLGARADAYQKISAAFPVYAQTDVALRRLGFDEEDIESLQAAARSQQAQQTLQNLLGGGTNAARNVQESGDRGDQDTAAGGQRHAEAVDQAQGGDDQQNAAAR